MNQETIQGQILEALEDSLLPLSISEIMRKVPSLAEPFAPVPLEQVYSPSRKYAAGQKLFHPGKSCRSWFVVEEPVTDNRFVARFDNGEVKTLVHSDSRIDFYRFTIEYWESEQERLAREVLSRMTGVVIIAGLYTLQSRFQHLALDRLSDPNALFKLAQLRARNRPEDRIDQLRDICRRRRLMALYYLAPLDNLPSILEKGILAKNLSPSGHVTFANEDIQAKRHRIMVRNDLPLTLHDCVPLFFAPKPPLLYLLKEEQQKIVYIRVNPVILLEPGVVFSRVNARSTPEFFTDIADLDKLDWTILRAHYWKSDDTEQHRQNKLLRQAEAQIPVVVPVNHISQK